MLVNKNNNWLNFTLSCCFCVVSLFTTASQRDMNIDLDWKFHLGDVIQAKSVDFDDSQWRSLNLPHDWSIEGEYSEDNPAGWRGAFLPTGIGWYRKHLKVSPEWKDKRVILRFDGVYLNSDVWINGKHVGHRPNGYVSFGYDITEQLMQRKKMLEDLVISVRVDHSLAPTGRWYTGSGIYRHVWLDVVDKTYIPNDGIFVRTEKVNFQNNDAVLLVDTEIKGIGTRKNLFLQHQLLNTLGEVVATADENLSQSHNSISRSKISLPNAKLWSIDTPYLYTLNTTILDGSKRIDQIETRVGIRMVDYNVNQGFLLNNQAMELYGMSFHHDAGPVGSAVPDDIWRHRLKQLKLMGVNALRPAHTPFAPIFYDLADEMGFVVMNEAFDGWQTEKASFDYGLHFEQWWQTDLSSIIKRDRSHPSVVMWSVGNEVTNQTSKMQKTLVEFIKKLDPTRPVTQGRGYMLGHLDIDGFNGHGEFKGYVEEHHAKHPNMTVIGTEITHTLQTRGIYRTKTSYRTKDNPAPWEIDDPIGRWNKIKDRVHMVPDFTKEEVFVGENPKYQSSYDNSFVRMGVRDEIKLAKRLPYLLGTFRWTAFDYLGESFGWPARTANFGVIDLAGFEKDAYYLYQSQWTEAPMVHMLPHWTHPGKGGVEIPVVVYTNLAEAELFLNGKSLGKKTMTDDLQIVWLVPYQAGELKVIASDGEIKLTKAIHTAGEAFSTALSSDKLNMRSNNKDVSHITIDIIDDEGRLVPRADNLVTLTLSGPGKIIGVENGDILDHGNHIATTRKVFNGKLMVLLQATDQTGDIRLSVSGENLKTKSIVIKSNGIN
jgi:beta-galactosidase